MRMSWLGTMAVLILCGQAMGQPTDACEIIIPARLRTILLSHNTRHRMPRVSDSKASPCWNDRVRQGRTECLLAITTDFDGDGQRDYAVIMPARNAQERPLLVTAFGDKSGWKLEPLKIGTQPPNGMILEILEPGEWRETPAVLPTGVIGRKVSSKNPGLMVGTCESWADGYFYLDGRWFSIALTD